MSGHRQILYRPAHGRWPGQGARQAEAQCACGHTVWGPLAELRLAEHVLAALRPDLDLDEYGTESMFDLEGKSDVD